ncbi:hypothetical protein CDD81_4758 [Ophiocordyceps australis]|uniref:Uncharacterized protein n=1 Tax=Ophiocordyceps australis TaxID=1399860 RepID=A0A2C5YBD4_9HYPO|nr:hypothetical protein CDD81_4758 [Ophiocordyceps australis]
MCYFPRRRNKQTDIADQTYPPSHQEAPTTMPLSTSKQPHGQTSSLPGPAPNTAGPHRHDVLNKLDPTVDAMTGGAQVLGANVAPMQPHGGRAQGGSMGVAEGTYGPHASRTGNALDPRVDSDADGRARAGYGRGPAGYEGGQAGYGRGPAGYEGGQTGYRGAQAGYQGAPAGYGSHAAYQGGHTGGYTGYDDPNKGTFGPHASRSANALDPRVDSHHHDARARHGYESAPHAGYEGAHGGTHVAEGTHGPHASRAANALDPRVDSDRDNRAARHEGVPRVRAEQLAATGPAANTAGPHRSDWMNKLDPRVESKPSRYV